MLIRHRRNTSTPTKIIRPAIATDAKPMGALHVAASRRVYAGLVPDRALEAITPAGRARRSAESLTAARPDDGIFVSEANASIGCLAVRQECQKGFSN